MPAPSTPDRPAVAAPPARRAALGLLAAAVGLVVVGCRGDAARRMIAANNDTNAKRLATLSGFFQLRHELRGPRDEAELRAFIAAQDPGRLALAGVSPASLDTLFTS